MEYVYFSFCYFIIVVIQIFIYIKSIGNSTISRYAISNACGAAAHIVPSSGMASRSTVAELALQYLVQFM